VLDECIKHGLLNFTLQNQWCIEKYSLQKFKDATFYFSSAIWTENCKQLGIKNYTHFFKHINIVCIINMLDLMYIIYIVPTCMWSYRPNKQPSAVNNNEWYSYLWTQCGTNMACGREQNNDWLFAVNPKVITRLAVPDKPAWYAQWDKLATKLSWQCFALKVVNFQLPHVRLTYSTCIWCLCWGDHVWVLPRFSASENKSMGYHVALFVWSYV